MAGAPRGAAFYRQPVGGAWGRLRQSGAAARAGGLRARPGERREGSDTGSGSYRYRKWASRYRKCGLDNVAMGIGGKINRPRTELKKKLFKRRRVLARGGRQRKRRSVPRDVPLPPLWGKRRRKMLKRLRAAARGSPPPPPPDTAGGGGRRPERGDPPDVEMVAVGEP